MKLICKFLVGFVGLLSISQMAFADIEPKSPSKSKKPMYREITPNAGPRVVYGWDVFLTANFLWWKAKQSGLIYGTTGLFRPAQTTTDASRFLPRGREAQVKYDWDSGFKAGAGLNFWHDGWDVYSQYTWLHTDGSSSISRQDNVVLPFILTGGALNNTETLITDSAQSHANLHFNVVDLELGRNFYISQFLTLRPHIGCKGTWQNQSWRTNYISNNFLLNLQEGSAISVSGPYRTHHNNKYYGVGFRFGIDTAWHFTSNWSIFGDIAWTAMWSRYRLLRRDAIHNNLTAQKYLIYNTRSNFYDIKFIGELQAGLRFDIWFSDDRYHLQVQAGWEEQLWINHMTFIQFATNPAYYDMTTQGLTAMLRFDF